jgi:lipid II:glycine glycyltransferase (peptidoglycan interpeptide bridge formation enzyme)
MQASPIDIDWHSGLPIFAKESFLKGVGDNYGWLGGIDEAGELRCILPYTIIRKAVFRMVRFRVETISLEKELSVQEEKSFLNSAVEYFRSIHSDMIIPATTNTIFGTFPDGADAAPYGSYIVDLCQPEETLWRNMNRSSHRDINTALKDGVCIRSGIGYLDVSYELIRKTFERSKMPFMGYEALKLYVQGLGEHGKIMVAEYENVLQSCIIYAFSDYCAYAVYGGNVASQTKGAHKLLNWEAIRLFKNLGVRRYDLVGARIDPQKGSKAEALSSLKRGLGGKLRQGYMWKYSLNPLKYRLYCLAARLRSGGDIVDTERHKLAIS